MDIANRKLTIILYLVAIFLFWAALYYYVPTLPLYAQSQADDLALVGTVVAQYGLWQFVIRIPLGVASDWLGRRKPFIIFGFLCAGLGAWLMGSAGNVQQIIIGRGITGLASGGWVPLAVAFNSLFLPSESVRASALASVANSLGRMLATGSNGYLNNLGGYPLAFFCAAGTAVIAIIVILMARENSRPVQARSLRSVWVLATRPDVLNPSLLSAVQQFALWTSTFGFFPILARQLGASAVVQGLMISGNIGLILIGNLVVSTLSKRIGERAMVYAAFILVTAGLVLAAVAQNLSVILVAQFLIGLSEGIGYPIMMGLSIRQVAEEQRSTAMGVHQSVYAIGMFTGPWLSGILAGILGVQPMFWVAAVFILTLGLWGTFACFSQAEKRQLAVKDEDFAVSN